MNKLIRSIILFVFGLAIFYAGISCNRQVVPASQIKVKFGSYPSSGEISTYIIQLEKLHPDYADIYEIGASWGKRPILAMRITDEKSGDPEKKPAMYMDAGHHGNEKISMQTALFFITYILDNSERDPLVAHLLKTRTLYVVPLVNPDGNDSGERTNKNPNIPVDLNRNYEYGWQAGFDKDRAMLYGGTDPFSEPETRAIKKFVLEHKNINIALTLHSGIDRLHTPGFTIQENFPQDAQKYDLISGEASIIAGRNGFSPPGLSPLGIAKGSGGAGTTMAWLHANSIYAWTVEVYGDGKYPWETIEKYNPPEEHIEDLCNRWLKPFLYYWSSLPNLGLYGVKIKNNTLYITIGNDGKFPMDALVQVWKKGQKVYYLTADNLTENSREIMIPLPPEELTGDFIISLSGNTTTGPQNDIFKLSLSLSGTTWSVATAEGTFESKLPLMNFFK